MNAIPYESTLPYGSSFISTGSETKSFNPFNFDISVFDSSKPVSISFLNLATPVSKSWLPVNADWLPSFNLSNAVCTLAELSFNVCKPFSKDLEPTCIFASPFFKLLTPVFNFSVPLFTDVNTPCSFSMFSVNPDISALSVSNCSTPALRVLATTFNFWLFFVKTTELLEISVPVVTISFWVCLSKTVFALSANSLTFVSLPFKVSLYSMIDFNIAFCSSSIDWTSKTYALISVFNLFESVV